MFSLQGDRVLVVGGTSGIGLGAAQAMKAAGAAVTVASRSAEKVAAAAASAGVEGVVLDAGNDGAVEAFFASRDPWNHVVVSVTAAHKGRIREMAMDDAMASMNQKFWSAFRIARSGKFAPDGSLIFVSGQVGKRPRIDAILQGAINAGLEGLARGLALDLSPLRVNVVSPGPVDTPQLATLSAAQREALESAIERLPVRRIGAPADIGEAIVFLACNRFMTGATLRVDGGSTVA
jgi:NAD(P)-dependent dehydrogenase (short-subunit alcohol dehydrogenase family)